jgi:hypothetical protein
VCREAFGETSDEVIEEQSVAGYRSIADVVGRGVPESESALAQNIVGAEFAEICGDDPRRFRRL